MAGMQPIAAASVQLYAMGSAGNGSAAASLLSGAATSDANGAFTIASGYGCPASSSQLYLVVRGGQVGNSAGNAAIVLAAPIGECKLVSGATQFVVNEVTTAATAWALAQFLGAGGNIGATATNPQGLANAVATAANLVNPATGTSPGAAYPANATSPAAKINSLANLLNTCTGTGSGCSSLFAATTPSGGTAPGNTFDAALNLVRDPGSNIAALYAQAAANPVFAPALSAAPSDWTLFIDYSGGGMSSPSGIGVDAGGNVWVASYDSVASEFSPTGASLYTSVTGFGGLFHSYGLAVDGQNNVWIPDEDSNSVNNTAGAVTVLSSTGQLISGVTGFSAGGLNYPVAVAIDPTDGNAWLVNYGNSSLTLLSSSGQPLSGAKGYASDQLLFPVAVAVDASHNAWVANSSGSTMMGGMTTESTITKVSADGSQVISYACCNGAGGLAIDQRGNVWVANFAGDSISLLSSAGTLISSGFSDNKASIYHPQGIAIDGSGNVWAANFLGNSITELAGSAAGSPGQILSPTAGYAKDASLLKAYAIAIDASGNVWVTNFGNNTLTEVVGLAAPVKTPTLGPAQSP